MKAGWIGASVALLTASGGVAAEDGGALQGLLRCRTVPEAAARLACFEQATDALERQVAGKEVRIVNRKDLREARRSLFGFPIARIPLLGDQPGDERRPDADTEIITTITSASPLANGRMQLRLAEGDAVWTTTDPLAFPPRPGTKIRIRRGALGNYFLAIGNERSVRGMRLR